MAALPGQEGLSLDLVVAQLAEAGRMAGEVLAPLNSHGDREGCLLEASGRVRTPRGFRPAYAGFVAGGWPALPFDPAYGGQGLPWLVAAAAGGMWSGANMAFALCPLLTQAVAHLLDRYGAARLKADYLRPLVAGHFTAALAFTETESGSDLGAVRCRAVRQGEHWRLTGRKTPVSWGEHDLTENILHLVLAQTPDHPHRPSLFLVPKRMPGGLNEIGCVALLPTLGLRASPAATLVYGGNQGAAGWLLGDEGQGLALVERVALLMRLLTGLQGVAVADRAYGAARDHAFSRCPGRLDGGTAPPRLIDHPDLRRRLLTTKAEIEATRALAYHAAATFDIAQRHPDPVRRAEAEARFALLVPLVKGWGAEVSLRSTNTALQVFGIRGYERDSEAVQSLRDVRSVGLMDSSPGLQALDLANRRVLADGGRAIGTLLAEMRDITGQLSARQPPVPAPPGSPPLPSARVFGEAVESLRAGVGWLLERREAPETVAAAATPFLRLFGVTAAGWMMARAALAAADGKGGDPAFLRARQVSAAFHIATILPHAPALLADLRAGGEILGGFPAEGF